VGRYPREVSLDYFIWNTERNLWWKKRKWGYTSNIELAGVYSPEEAMEICVTAARGGTFDDIPVLVDDAMTIAKSIVNQPATADEREAGGQPEDLQPEGAGVNGPRLYTEEEMAKRVTTAVNVAVDFALQMHAEKENAGD